MTYLVTGAAGFIGYHVCAALLARGESVLGIDNLNDYYSVSLKEDRLALLSGAERFSFQRLDIADRGAVADLFEKQPFEVVINLAAQAGVRYSLEAPHAYADANLVGFLNILEGCRHARTPHLVYASTSSIYGANTSQPFSEHHGTAHPLSLYAATKKANEMMAHSYSHLYDLPTTGLRFFTVYGPWGRPDMALFKFTKAILADQPIDLYNNGQMVRDFTYIDDIVAGILAAAAAPPQARADFDAAAPDPATSHAPYRLFNIGAATPTPLMDFVRAIEAATGKPAKLNEMPMQSGDVTSTWADVSELQQAVGYAPSTQVADGVARFVEWYRSYYQV